MINHQFWGVFFFGNILISLTFGDEFSHSLVNVTLPNILHDQSLEGVTFPHSLQNLTFGSDNRANPVAGCICRGNCRYCLCG